MSTILNRVARFQREANLLAALNHPHIAAIYGLEEVNGAYQVRRGRFGMFTWPGRGDGISGPQAMDRGQDTHL
jgi:hypothetical protein